MDKEQGAVGVSDDMGMGMGMESGSNGEIDGRINSAADALHDALVQAAARDDNAYASARSDVGAYTEGTGTGMGTGTGLNGLADPLPDGIPDVPWLPGYPSSASSTSPGVAVSEMYTLCPSSVYGALLEHTHARRATFNDNGPDTGDDDGAYGYGPEGYWMGSVDRNGVHSADGPHEDVHAWFASPHAAAITARWAHALARSGRLRHPRRTYSSTGHSRRSRRGYGAGSTDEPECGYGSERSGDDGWAYGAGAGAGAGIRAGDDADALCTVYLIGNAGTVDVAGMTVNVSLAYQHVNASVYPTVNVYDLLHGTQIAPIPPPSTADAHGTTGTAYAHANRQAIASSTDNGAAGSTSAGGADVTVSLSGDTLTLDLPAGLFIALLFDPTPMDTPTELFLQLMRNITQTPLSSYSSAWYPMNQTMTPIIPSPAAGAPPPGMVLIPGASSYRFTVDAALPEAYLRPDASNAASGPGIDVQYPWESIGAFAHHEAVFDVSPYYMDVNLVTNQDYYAFIQGSGYNGSGDGTNFLRHWVQYPNGTFMYNVTAGDATRPVIWVSQEDASAFCTAYGKRLPMELEWQFAVQALANGGTDYRSYPWGNGSCTPALCPPVDTTREPRSPDQIGGYPAGSSDTGLLDLVGNVWQITDTFCDPVNCAVVLRGGSLYEPIDPSPGPFGSRYWPQAKDANHHVRLPFASQACIRSGYVGFRCVADTPFSSAVGHALVELPER